MDALGTLMVVLPMNPNISVDEACQCHDLYFLGTVNYTEQNWYKTTAGIQAYDLSDQPYMPFIKSRPLGVVEVCILFLLRDYVVCF